ncbi:MAG TPA: efflux RND transporter permease subunit [Pseudomonadota bacterium]|nr:efflux RND transporter permease subunit [Pseudomonadota bacterium]
MTLPQLSIQRPVLAIVMNLVIVLVGLIAWDRLAVRLVPKVDLPVVTVNTTYPGANAQVVESQITTPIEEALAGIEGIDYIQSISRAENSQVTVRFHLDRDPDGAASDVRDRVAQARGFLPEEVNEPIVQKQEADAQPIMYLAFSSDRHDELEVADVAERLVKDRVQTIVGVAQAQVYASRYAMRIWLDPARLAGYGLVPLDIEDALRRQNVEVPAGRIEGQQREFTVLSETDLRTPEQFKAIVVKETSGYSVRLGDVADVELGPTEERVRGRFDGKRAVPLGVVKTATANPLDVSRGIAELLPKITASLPEGMRVDIGFDSTRFIESSVRAVYTTIVEAILLVVLVIFVFLRTLRATLIPLVTIPVSLIGAFALMALFGFSINTLTLLAMVLAIGLVVDDAIVMLENIHRHIEAGLSPMEASLKGSREIGFAIVAMTLTLAAVYAPMAFSTGRTGKLFIEFALTLAGAVLVSGFVALTLSPMMCSRLLRPTARHGRFYEFGERALNGLVAGYRRLLGRALARRGIVLAVAGLIVVAAGLLFWRLPSELAPQEDQGFVMAFSIAPEGSTIEYTDGYARQLEAIYSKTPELNHYFQFTGWPSVTNSIAFMGLKPWTERERSAQDIQGSLFMPFSEVPGVLAFPVVPPPLGNEDFGQPVSFVVQSTGTWEELSAIVEKLVAKMGENPRLTNPDSDLKLNKPELKVEMDREKVAAVGADVAAVGRTLETLLGGRNVTRFKRGSEQYDVIVQVRREERARPDDLTAIHVRGRNDAMVPLANLVTVRESVAAKELNHFNKLRAATISAGLAPGYTMGEALAWMEQALDEVARDNAQYDLSGQSREFRESSSSFGLMMALALAFIFLVLAAQFESFVDPFVILLAVPLAAFGALLALWLTGGTWNIYSQIGVITLVGLIAKHGILIVEFANQLREQGRDPASAALESAVMRLRPILMTTGAMVFGALPLALATGAGAEARHQIGWVIVGGMSLGTVFTLFVVPVVYTLLERASHVRKAVVDEAIAPSTGHA